MQLLRIVWGSSELYVDHSGMKYSKLIVYCFQVQYAEHFTLDCIADSMSFQVLYLDHNHIGSPGAVSIFRSL